jgi:PKD repeat protein
MKSGHKHGGVILFIVNAFIFLSFITSLAATTNYQYDDVNRVIRVERGTNTLIPVANFSASPTTGLEPLTVNFTDLSTHNPTSWQWDFGDSSTSTAQNPSHIYASHGTYTVSLTVSNANGSNTKTVTNCITVNACPHLVRIVRGTPVYFSSLQDAYNVATNGEVIQSTGTRFTENLQINRNITVTLDGGYDCQYATNSGMTSLKGMIQTTSTGGTLTIKNFVIEQ